MSPLPTIDTTIINHLQQTGTGEELQEMELDLTSDNLQGWQRSGCHGGMATMLVGWLVDWFKL